MGSKALAVENTTKKEDKPKPVPKAKPEAAPVLPQADHKKHNDQEKGKGKYEKGKGKGKGKGKDKSRGRSPSQRTESQSHVFITFRKVDVLKRVRLVAHSVIQRERQIVVPVMDLETSKGGNPKNDRTPSPKPKSEKPCFLYARGKM